jgi:hypothetical protein
MTATTESSSRRGSLAIPLATSAGLLIVSWVVPDAIAESAVFAWDRIAAAGAFELAAVLAPPACGALLILAVLLPIRPRSRALMGRVIGPVAVMLPLLGVAPAVPVPGWIVAVAAVAGAAAAAYLLSREHNLWAHVVLGAMPVAMLGLWLSGVLGGEPAGFLAGIKAPVVVYAGMLATSTSAGRLLDPSLEKER